MVKFSGVGPTCYFCGSEVQFFLTGSHIVANGHRNCVIKEDLKKFL